MFLHRRILFFSFEFSLHFLFNFDLGIHFLFGFFSGLLLLFFVLLGLEKILLGNSFGSYLKQLSEFPRSPMAPMRYVLDIAGHVNEFRILTVCKYFFAALQDTS
jgi:hypothetical protein